jgi:hypothetical protein
MKIAWDRKQLKIVIKCKNDYEFGCFMTLIDKELITKWEISEEGKNEN